MNSSTGLRLACTLGVDAQVLSARDGRETDQACQGLEALGAGEMRPLGREHSHVDLGFLERALLRLHTCLEAAGIVLDGIEGEGGRKRRQHQGPVDPAKHHGFPSLPLRAQVRIKARESLIAGVLVPGRSVGAHGRTELGRTRAGIGGDLLVCRAYRAMVKEPETRGWAI